MPVLLLAAAAGLSFPAAHEMTMRHGDTFYQLEYRSHADLDMRTIGMAAGSRPSTQRCLWSATLRVERTIRASGAQDGLRRLLPDARAMEGSRPGPCRQARRSIEAELARRIAGSDDHVRAVAQADADAARADIEAAHALAAR